MIQVGRGLVLRGFKIRVQRAVTFTITLSLYSNVLTLSPQSELFKSILGCKKNISIYLQYSIIYVCMFPLGFYC